jgi:hypothetical protein
MLLALLFAFVGVGFLYFGWGHPVPLIIGIVCIVVAIMLAATSFDSGSVEEGKWLLSTQHY